VTRYTFTQFSLSTAEHAENYFSGEQGSFARPTQTALAPGLYRVIDGALTRIVPGIPNELASHPEGLVRRDEPHR
jgi:hypothetical protein